MINIFYNRLGEGRVWLYFDKSRYFFVNKQQGIPSGGCLGVVGGRGGGVREGGSVFVVCYGEDS